MTTLNVASIECSRFGTFGIQAIYLLSIGLVLCILLLIRRSKFRAAVLDAETGIPYPTVNEGDIGKKGLHLEYTQVADQRTHYPGFLDPFADAEYLNSRPVTSGFLAAKADIDNAEKATGPEQESLTTTLGPQKMDSNPPDTVDDQQAPWRRHSYPSGQDQIEGLRGDSLHDSTEHFCDSHEAGIIWRRRIMIFQDKS